ncbi:hypothetical protein [Rhodovulum sp. PH10]|uniref:hypothetical protein n=1 Tax=Rhodovulum sp. PH10 TaxID=1187851 RepID=UPI00178C219E|nr:hypothetical protein [Rhodovulum sp. PH10]
METGQPKHEYFIWQPGLTAETESYVRLRRVQDAVRTWEYDFIAAKDITKRKIVAYLDCERSTIREMVPDREGRARQAFRNWKPNCGKNG